MDGVPFNFLHIFVEGKHADRKVLAGVRNYYVISGNGMFFVEDEGFSVEAGTLITIWPGEVYSYAGVMEMIEFNVDQGDGIAHEDVG